MSECARCSTPAGGCDCQPANHCLTHRPPKRGQRWRLADRGYRTCSDCHKRIHELLSPLTKDDDGQPDSIPGLYAALDARPERGTVGRRSPGFRSSPPANEHIITMADVRSKSCEVARDAVEYVWDPDADNGHPPLPPGVEGPEREPGAWVDKRDVWFGGDGRTHHEQERPPRSIPHAVASWVALVAEERDAAPGKGNVAALCVWLDRHLDWITKQDWVDEFAADLRGLYRQLKTIRSPRWSVGRCPNTIDEGEHTRVCGAALFAPIHGDAIECWACARTWTRREWMRLGDLLEAS